MGVTRFEFHGGIREGSYPNTCTEVHSDMSKPALHCSLPPPPASAPLLLDPLVGACFMGLHGLYVCGV